MILPCRTQFHRLQQRGLPLLLLQTQYRMHPLISLFPNYNFYEGRISNGVAEHERTPPRGLNWPLAPRLVEPAALFGNVPTPGGGAQPGRPSPPTWRHTAAVLVATEPQKDVELEVAHGGAEPDASESDETESESRFAESAAEGNTYENGMEAELALAAAYAVAEGGDAKDVVLLTPYRGQVLFLFAFALLVSKFDKFSSWSMCAQMLCLHLSVRKHTSFRAIPGSLLTRA